MVGPCNKSCERNIFIQCLVLGSLNDFIILRFKTVGDIV